MLKGEKCTTKRLRNPKSNVQHIYLTANPFLILLVNSVEKKHGNWIEEKILPTFFSTNFQIYKIHVNHHKFNRILPL